jgi:hypothetical protein
VKWSEIRLLGGNLGRREGKGWVFIFFLSPKGSIMVGGWVFFFPPSFKNFFLGGWRGVAIGVVEHGDFSCPKYLKFYIFWGVFWVDKVECFYLIPKGLYFG